MNKVDMLRRALDEMETYLYQACDIANDMTPSDVEPDFDNEDVVFENNDVLVTSGKDGRITFRNRSTQEPILGTTYGVNVLFLDSYGKPLFNTKI